MNERYKKSIESINKDIDRIKNKQSEQDECTQNALMFLTTHMDYLKHSYHGSTVKDRRFHAESFLARTFGNYDPSKISFKLSSNGFLLYRHVLLIAFILTNIVTSPILYYFFTWNIESLFIVFLYLVLTFIGTMLIITFISESKMSTYRIKPSSKWNI